MARRFHMTLLGTGAALAMAMTMTMGSAPALAQMTPEETRDAAKLFEAINRADAYLARLEQLRLAGDCAGFTALLGQSYQYLAMPGFLDRKKYELLGKYSDALADMRKRPCPPVADTPPPAAPAAQLVPGQGVAPVTTGAKPATTPAPAPVPPPESILDSIDETPPKPKPTSTAPVSGPPMTFEAMTALAERAAQHAEQIDRNHATAEAARLAGDCAGWKARLDAVQQLIDEPGFPYGQYDAEAGTARFNQYRARLAEARARPCPPPAPPKEVGALPGQPDADRRANVTRAFLALYYSSILIPRTGIGVRRDGPPGGAPERDAGLSSRRINSFGISAGFQTKISDDFDLHFGGGYTEGRATEIFTSPATSPTQRVDTGIVYGRLSNGSSGIIAGGGGSGEGRSKLSAAYVYAEAMGFRVEVGSGEIEVGAGVGYERADTRHDLSFASSVVSGGSTFNFAQTRTQQLGEDYLDFSSRIDFDIPFSGTTDGGLTFSGTVKIGPYRRESSFTGTERDTANFGPVGNRDLTLNFTEKQGGWGGRIKLSAGLEYELPGGVALTAGGGIDYRSEVGAIVNPNSGDQVFFQGQTTRLETSDRFVWHTAAGIRIPF